MSARVETQREDVTSLFRKFGGDASEYREFAPVAEPVTARPIAPVATTAPAAPAAPVTVAEPKAVEVEVEVEAVAVVGAPRELDVIFQRLASVPPTGVPAPGLMAMWRRST